ncbi:MAG: hypothetical protein ACI3YC_02635 [Alloprevotella sp.]
MKSKNDNADNIKISHVSHAFTPKRFVSRRAKRSVFICFYYPKTSIFVHLQHEKLGKVYEMQQKHLGKVYEMQQKHLGKVYQ